MVTILGPTASGKTNLAVKIASEFNGEIISADSRQIYIGMDIGTGKDLDEYTINNQSIPYHLIDIINPKKNYSIYNYQEDCKKARKVIEHNNKLPILCGGSGLYLESILLNYQISETPPNKQLRLDLSSKSFLHLVEELKSIDTNEYKSTYHISRRRLIRSIEILKNSKKANMNINNSSSLLKTLVIGIKIDRSIVLDKIKIRLDKRMKGGMIKEVENLLNRGLSIDRLKYFGLEYKYIANYLDQTLSYDDMLYQLNNAINRFAKRQMTFFRRMEKRGININWAEASNYQTISDLISQHLKN